MNMHRILKLVTFVLVSAATGILGVQTWAHGEPPSQFTAKVIHVDDGDTVVAMVEPGRKLPIRLASIEAPETHKNRCKPGQPFGQEAKNALAMLVSGKTEKFVCYEADRYGRQVCDIHLDGGTTASRELVKQGLAWPNTSNPRYLRDPQVTDLASRAKFAHLGLWSESNSMPPWEWRASVWRNTCPADSP